MKKWLLWLIVLLTWSLASASEFDKLQKLEQDGLVNADLYYNLGVANWQMGNSGVANLYFLKALNTNSSHKQAKENLQYVIDVSQDKDLYSERLFLVRAFLNLYDFFTLNRLAIVCLVLLFVSILALHWLLHYDPEKEKGLPTLVLGICLFLFAVAVVLAGVKGFRQKFNDKAVVILPEATLRKDGTEDSSRVAVLHEALIVHVEKETASMSFVRLPDGNSGWVDSSAIRKVVE